MIILYGYGLLIIFTQNFYAIYVNKWRGMFLRKIFTQFCFYAKFLRNLFLRKIFTQFM